MPSSILSSKFVNTFKKGTEYTCAQIKIGGSGEGLGVQQVKVTINKEIQQMYEIGSMNTYYVGSRPRGTGQASNIIGPAAEALNMATMLGDVCNPKDLIISAGAKECQMVPSAEVTCISCAINMCDITAVAQTDMVTGTWGFVFADMSYSGGGGASGVESKENTSPVKQVPFDKVFDGSPIAAPPDVQGPL